jgi:hypothetical protein
MLRFAQHDWQFFQKLFACLLTGWFAGDKIGVYQWIEVRDANL